MHGKKDSLFLYGKSLIPNKDDRVAFQSNANWRKRSDQGYFAAENLYGSFLKCRFNKNFSTQEFYSALVSEYL